jgi:hypothetical protein
MKLTTYLHLVPRSKNAWNCTPTPPICLYGVVLSLKKKHRGNFTFLPFTYRNSLWRRMYATRNKSFLVAVPTISSLKFIELRHYSAHCFINCSIPSMTFNINLNTCFLPAVGSILTLPLHIWTKFVIVDTMYDKKLDM